MNDLVLVERDGPIATVVLNRADKLNALTREMWQGLGDAVRSLSADDSLRCIILRGAGEKSFSPGNDIAEFASVRSNKAQAIAYGRIMHATAQALDDCRHPLVAQIHGICVGGGLEIAALCDLRICGAGSRFGAPIKNLGLVMAYAEMAPLVRLVGAASRWRSCSKAACSTLPRRRTRARHAHRCRRPGGRRGARDRAAHRRRRAADRALAQAVRAPPGRPAAAHGCRARSLLRLLRHRRLPHRLPGVPRQGEAAVRGAIGGSTVAAEAGEGRIFHTESAGEHREHREFGEHRESSAERDRVPVFLCVLCVLCVQAEPHVHDCMLRLLVHEADRGRIFHTESAESTEGTRKSRLQRELRDPSFLRVLRVLCVKQNVTPMPECNR
jgi:enoyl-CoA hydratase/carnithine racemase